MGRTPTTGTADTATEPREPEVMRSGDLANIVTLELVEMIDEATKRYEAASMGRKMAGTLAACRGLVRDVRALHRLPAIDWRTGLPMGQAAGNGQVDREAYLAEHGHYPDVEAAEVAS
jgi:hypothetical protein